MDTIEIPNSEIFQAGTYHNGTITVPEAALDQIVANFAALGGKIKPVLVLGHGEDQKFLRDSGLPSAGWLTNIRKVGSKLVADFKDVPRLVGDLIKRGAYRRVSAEIYSNYHDDGGKPMGHVLRRVALLGGDLPEVKTLQDLAALYSEGNGAGDAGALELSEPKVTDFNEPTNNDKGETMLTPNPDQGTLAMFNQAQVDTLVAAEIKKAEDAAAAKFAEKTAALEKEKADLDAKAKAAEAEQARFAEKAHADAVEAFCETLKKGDGKNGLAPAIVDQIKPILTTLDHSTARKFGETQITPFEAVKSLIETMAKAITDKTAVVPFSETAPATDESPKAHDDPGLELDRRAVAYQAEHGGPTKVTYTEAIDNVLSTDPELAKAYNAKVQDRG